MLYTIKELRNDEAIPLDLLLLADPSKEAIHDYLSRGACYVAIQNNVIVGSYIMCETRPMTVEIMNIAVDIPFQNQGIGKALLQDAFERAILQGAKMIEIGTGNSSIQQLAFYQKCGFRIVGIDTDYFIRHYDEEIYEFGIRCVDMIRLRKYL